MPRPQSGVAVRRWFSGRWHRHLGERRTFRCANEPQRGGGRAIPFTPFHFGPGLLAKACVPRYFWLTSFLLANVLIDVEVLFYLWRDDPPIHRHLHSYIGGTAMGTIAGVVMFVTIQTIRRALAAQRRLSDRFARAREFHLLIQSGVSGVIGGVSHVFLDSLMHRDMQPFWPFSDHNGLVGLVDVGALHIGCAVAGFFGLAFWLLLQRP
jgi:hypothetical protein